MNVMKKILIICQARFGSTRLPGKVLKKVGDRELLWYEIKRLQLVKTQNTIILATTKTEKDKEIMYFANNNNINCFLGSEDDVLDRFYQAAKEYNGDIIVRITGDCPLIDPDVIDQAINIFLEGDYDYVSNVEENKETYPDGLDVEVFSFQALERAHREAKWQSEREHVTPYIRKNSDKFSLKHFRNKEDLSSFRLTVDTPEDYEFLSYIINNFKDKWDKFRMYDIIDYLKENLPLLKINAQYERNEGYLKSIREDKIVKN